MIRCIFITLLLSSFMSFSQVILFVNKNAIINDNTLEEISFANEQMQHYFLQAKENLLVDLHNQKISKKEYFFQISSINESVIKQKECYIQAQKQIRDNHFDLEKQFKKTVEVIAKKRKAFAVLYINNVDDAAYVNPEYDITEDVINLIYGAASGATL